MPDEQRNGGSGSELIVELRELLDETQRTIDASRTILDRCTADAPDLGDGPGSDLLGEIADGLIHAYRFAREENDAATVALVERAMLHVGHRLAHGLTPEEAGVVRH